MTPYGKRSLAAAAAAVTVGLAGGVAAALIGTGPAPKPAAADPETTTAARAAAVHLLGDYSSRRWGDAWQMLTPAAQHAVTQATWSAFYQRCDAAKVVYQVVDAAIPEPGTAYVTIIVDVTSPGAGPNGSGSVTLVFYYQNKRWRYSPATLSVFQHPTVAGDLAAARASGFC